MRAELTEKEFSKHVNSKFQLQFEDRQVELDLDEVRAYRPQENEQHGLERFSVFFKGPNVYLPQQVYSVNHAQMGQFEIFLVPVSQSPDGFRYEAVFNYSRDK